MKHLSCQSLVHQHNHSQFGKIVAVQWIILHDGLDTVVLDNKRIRASRPFSPS